MSLAPNEIVNSMKIEFNFKLFQSFAGDERDCDSKKTHSDYKSERAVGSRQK
jgi:hypothetical protein